MQALLLLSCLLFSGSLVSAQLPQCRDTANTLCNCQAFVTASTSICTLAEDRKAMNEIYTSLGGTSWLANTYWSTSQETSGAWTVDPCATPRWYGVFCSVLVRPTPTAVGYVYGSTTDRAYRVTTLALNGNNLQGQLPTSISTLDRLVELWVQNNPSLSGTIPPAILSLPRLTQFLGGGCGFGGSIPSLQLAVALEKFHIYDNVISGTVPGANSFPSAALSRIQELELQGNRLSGTLPTDMATNLPNISKLRLDNNLLSGTLPGSWSSGFRVLRILNISRNANLGGIFPNTLGSLSALQQLNISNCNFHCIFPPYLENFTGIFSGFNNGGWYCPVPLVRRDETDPCVFPIAGTPNVWVNGADPVTDPRPSCLQGDPCLVNFRGQNYQLGCQVVLVIFASLRAGQSTADLEAIVRPMPGYSDTSVTFNITDAAINQLTPGQKLLELRIVSDETISASVIPTLAQTWLPDFGAMDRPLEIRSDCAALCAATGTCNTATLACVCAPGFFGPDCSLECPTSLESPSTQFFTMQVVNDSTVCANVSCVYDAATGVNYLPIECNTHGLCSSNPSTGNFECNCFTDSAGRARYEGTFCQYPACAQLGSDPCFASQGYGRCANGNCTCYDLLDADVARYITWAPEDTLCATPIYNTAFCGQVASEDGKLPADRGTPSYQWLGASGTPIWNISCVCSPGWRADPANTDFDGVNCDEKIPPTWPIILGLIILGVVLLAVGIFFFLKFKKFDPEKKRREMEMKALNGN